ncbi:cytochrome b [Alkalimarinus sediminis]|uniref:Cytochrome b n=2 Tax=Alkalimarinus sediminis TaxID=1632866 RepID=A0A9E8HHB7_9ALTE|nr:cytochrome b [Alkalimarinus sediminis]UZW74424.1 cytochrome b [Alkalimarinus sediminis]
MAMLNTQERYGSLSIAMHWLMLILMVLVYTTVELHELFDKGSEPRDLLKSLHFMFGMSIFFLVWIRLALRFMGPSPAISPTPANYQKKAATVMHIALYGLMIITPFMGWLLLSSVGRPVPFFGIELPTLIAENEEIKPLIKEIHQTIGSTGYYLIALHAVAALFHHYVQKDNTFTRMLPSKR